MGKYGARGRLSELVKSSQVRRRLRGDWAASVESQMVHSIQPVPGSTL
jgi:hypothetical protein